VKKKFKRDSDFLIKDFAMTSIRFMLFNRTVSIFDDIISHCNTLYYSIIKQPNMIWYSTLL